VERSDGELLRLAKAGQADAFAEFVARHTNRVYAFARASLGDKHDAEDATQETFLEAFRYAGRFDGRHPALSWLLGIAANRCRTWRRRDGRRARLIEGLSESEAASASQEAGHAGAGDDGEEACAEVRRVVGGLPPKYREPTILWYQQGLSHEEIAQALGITPGAVAMRIHRAKEMLRERLAHLDLAKGVVG
jgi:RNA polymerase sigma-70 factor (ECF subfamily)